MKFRRCFRIIATAVILFTGHQTLSAATILSTNLILNGDAEASIGAGNYDSSVPLPSWSTTATLTPVQYAFGNGEELNTADSTAISGGSNFFSGGPNNELATAIQTIQFADLASIIDASAVSAELSGYFGGFAAQNDSMSLTASFLSATNAILGTFSIGDASAVDRASQSQLLFRTANTSVPAGSRSVQLTLQSTRTEGTYNDGYADNFGFKLVPEPSSAILFASGILLCVRRRTLRSHERNG